MTAPPKDPFAALAQRVAAPGTRVQEALRAELTCDRTPHKARSRLTRMAWSAGAISLALVLTSLRAVVLSPVALLVGGVALGLGVFGSLFLGAIPGKFGRLSQPWRRVLLIGGALAAFGVLATQANTWISLGEFRTTEAQHSALVCARHSLLSGATGAAGLLWLWRRTDPYSPLLTGALLGMFGGVTGIVSVGLLCAEREGLHLTFGHGACLLVTIGVCSLAGKRWLQP